MEISISNIPSAGNGVFATRDYEKGEILGEYHGYVLGDGEKVPKDMRLYIYETSFNFSIVPDKDCVCRFINDAIDIGTCISEVANQSLGMSKREVAYLVKEVLNNPPTFGDFTDGFADILVADYNTDWYEDKTTRRVYVKATRAIYQGEELYIAYGWQYWRRHIYDKVMELYTAAE